MTVQRRRGQKARIWKVSTTIDRRGNAVKVAVEDGPHEVTGVFIPQRSSRGEVPGQLAINVVRMLISAELQDVELWSRVEYAGKEWDVVTPPSYHHGTRQTRHQSIDLRERP